MRCNLCVCVCVYVTARIYTHEYICAGYPRVYLNVLRHQFYDCMNGSVCECVCVCVCGFRRHLICFCLIVLLIAGEKNTYPIHVIMFNTDNVTSIFFSPSLLSVTVCIYADICNSFWYCSKKFILFSCVHVTTASMKNGLSVSNIFTVIN